MGFSNTAPDSEHPMEPTLPESAEDNQPSMSAELLGDSGALTLDALQLRLAAQMSPYRWSRALNRLAADVDAGRPLDEAFHRHSPMIPAQLRSLIGEALQVPDPTRLVLDAVQVRDKVRDNWRELMGMIAYPTLLFSIALGVGVAFSFVMRSTVDFSWIEEFGLRGYPELKASLDDQHHAVLGLAMSFGWIVLVLATIALIGPSWAWLAVMGGLLLIGRPLRWVALQELLTRFEMFIGQGLPSLAAAEAVSRSFHRSSQATVAAAIAARIKDGMPLGRSVSRSMLADGLCRPALELLDLRGGNMQQALVQTAELLGHLTEQRCRALAMILPVFLLALVGTIVWASICTYFMGLMPLVSMISSLA